MKRFIQNKPTIYLLFIALFYFVTNSFCQNKTNNLWHGIERTIHYQPEGTDFICTDGKLRFNRALYGTNTAFRVEAGDKPEFAMYMPGMGGNFKIGIINANKSKWLIDAEHIKAIYRPGSMLYEIKDAMLGDGKILITVLALADAEGMIIKTTCANVNPDIKICFAYGGATGKKFSRDGDIGADPESSFYLQPAYCKDNKYQLNNNSFALNYGSGKVQTEAERYEIQQPNASKNDDGEKQKSKQISGIFPTELKLQLSDGSQLETPLQTINSKPSNAPIITGVINANEKDIYCLIANSADFSLPNYNELNIVFNKAEAARKTLADRVQINTPDPYINTIGGALAVAADGIWESPSYLHGAVAWRMRLNAWRGAYVADPLGWHDRAQSHFSSYAKSQVTSPDSARVVADTALHLARSLEKMGTSMFSSGYISRNPGGDLRPHHYDMNLVFIDQLLNHFNYTGDTNYVREMWPLIKRHLAWEKRNFDADGDGLYDAYAAIWASDALQYSGGGVSHSSAYNYRANKTAAGLAKLIGEDGSMYEAEANKIYDAMQQDLWLKDKGWLAEFKDKMGLELVHPAAGLWTVYHAIDSKAINPFQAYQMLRYVDNNIPHIPVKANGLDGDYELLSTTNWQPYDWSLNNVVMAENLHTALAYWQTGRNNEAFNLWKSAFIESMYLGASPGNFQQLSFYDAVRGELYRDFGDPIGIAARTVTEGLFGIEPNALHDTLVIHPGFPTNWKFASLKVPDIFIDYKNNSDSDNYTIIQSYPKQMQLVLQIPAKKNKVFNVKINGKTTDWKVLVDAIGQPMLQIKCGSENKYEIKIVWYGDNFSTKTFAGNYNNGDKINLDIDKAIVLPVYDPQKTLKNIVYLKNVLKADINSSAGDKTFFIQMHDGAFTWWKPICFTVNDNKTNKTFNLPKNVKYEKLNLSDYFNDKVTNIFKHQYLSPRPTSTTLQLPTQGIGNWCYPLIMANIDDAGLRKSAGKKNEFILPDKTPFSIFNKIDSNNIVFTSQWDNFSEKVNIPLTGKAAGIELLMAGSTNPMQSRLVNGLVIAQYKDGTADTLQLINPDNWIPIEQDYIDDGFAFKIGKEKPLRVYLKTGEVATHLNKYTSIKGYSNMAIDGGAATVLEMPLNNAKELKSLTVKTLANDVIIGLMAATLLRSN